MLDQAIEALKTYDWGVDPKVIRPIDEAIAAADRIRAAVEAMMFEVREKTVRPTCTFGGAILNPEGHDSMARALEATLEHAGVRAADVEEVMLVGGSSLMTLVTDTIQECCPRATLARGEAFTAIVDGLAYAAEDKDRAIA